MGSKERPGADFSRPLAPLLSRWTESPHGKWGRPRSAPPGAPLRRGVLRNLGLSLRDERVDRLIGLLLKAHHAGNVRPGLLELLPLAAGFRFHVLELGRLGQAPHLHLELLLLGLASR